MSQLVLDIPDDTLLSLKLSGDTAAKGNLEKHGFWRSEVVNQGEFLLLRGQDWAKRGREPGCLLPAGPFGTFLGRFRPLRAHLSCLW